MSKEVPGISCVYEEMPGTSCTHHLAYRIVPDCFTTAKEYFKGREGAEAMALHRAKCARIRRLEREAAVIELKKAEDVKKELEELKQRQKDSWNQQHPGK